MGRAVILAVPAACGRAAARSLAGKFRRRWRGNAGRRWNDADAPGRNGQMSGHVRGGMMGGGPRGMPDMAVRDPEMFKLYRADMELEQQSHELAAQYRQVVKQQKERSEESKEQNNGAKN